MRIKTPNRVQFLLAATLTLNVQGADTSNWSNVQNLRYGDLIGVVQTDHKRLEGRFNSASAIAVLVESTGTLTISQDQVVRIYKIGLSRKKKMLIGGIVGLAAGGIVAATVGRRLNNEGFFGGSGGGTGSLAAIGGGAGIGVALGGLTGSGNTTVYQKKGVR